MDACRPQDFISKKISQSGDDLLVDQDGLDGRAAARQQVVKLFPFVSSASGPSPASTRSCSQRFRTNVMPWSFRMSR
jgi:hypothetical protein